MSFPDRPRAVVTGAGSGLGRAFCLELAGRGARILASDVNAAGLEETVQLCKGAAQAAACDVSRIEEVEALGRAADEKLGGVDLVVNNAGVAVAGPVGDVSVEDWRWVMGVNLWGVIHGCHVFVPRLKRQRSGHVINVASAAGLLSPPNMGPYNTTKAAVVALSETLYSELRPDGVGVSCLCPTFFKTNIAQSGRGPAHMMGAAKKSIEKMMDASKLDANDVARIALDQARNGELYVQPHADGRWMWRMKRAHPQRFHGLASRVVTTLMRRAGLA